MFSTSTTTNATAARRVAVNLSQVRDGQDRHLRLRANTPEYIVRTVYVSYRVVDSKQYYAHIALTVQPTPSASTSPRAVYRAYGARTELLIYMANLGMELDCQVGFTI